MRRRQVLGLSLAPLLAPFCTAQDSLPLPCSERSRAAEAKVLPRLTKAMAKKKLAPGNPVFLRAFKESSELEMWCLPPGGAQWVLFKTWKIARWSGTLGPKLKTGDGQTPEGIYHTNATSLNPLSQFHLSFNINYPNAWDRAHKRDGSLIMIHGSFLSIGCFAMTDAGIEEIYTLVACALARGQLGIPIHSFPFRMTAKRLAKAAEAPAEQAHLAFWRELEPAWSLFEASRRVPRVAITDGRYEISGV